MGRDGRRTAGELAEARRQVASMLHKLRGVVRTLEERGADGSRKAQITLAKRRVCALEIAEGLIGEALEREQGEGEASEAEKREGRATGTLPLPKRGRDG